MLEKVFDHELIGMTDPTKVCVKTDSVRHGYDRTVPHSMWTVSTVASSVIAALSDHPLHNFLILDLHHLCSVRGAQVHGAALLLWHCQALQGT